MSEAVTPKIGLALGSGGAKGLAHIGVIKVLEENNIPIHAIAGSSIGALIGGYYAAHKDSKRLEELALSFNRRRGFRLFDLTLKGGILKGQKLELLLNEMLEGGKFEKLKIPFAAVATDFNTAEPVILTKGDLIKALRASVSVPGFFQPITHQKRLLADGGLSNPVPVDILRSLGMDLVIAVNLDSLFVDEPIDKLPALSKIPMHSINILRHHLALHTTKTADILITPKFPFQVGLIGWSTFFNNRKAKEIIKAGEDATQDIIPQLKEMIRSGNKKEEKKSNLERLFSFFRKRSK